MPDPISWAVEGPFLAMFLLLGYLMGSIPFGLLLGKAFGLGDIRKTGSGNIGATNVLRAGGKYLAASTLLLDAAKAIVPVLIAKYFGSPDAAIAAGLGAFLGHLFPIWLGFKGGKGIATYLGITLAFSPLVALCFAIVWLNCAFIFRFSSLAALLATLASPIAAYALGHFQFAELLALLSLLAWIKHRANIARLIAGKEDKIGSSKK